MLIKEISFEQINEIWSTKLWVGRISPIEPYSAMVFLGGYDISYKDNEQVFLGGFIADKIVAVNSIHKANTNVVRSRGLWVDESHRGKGLGSTMLLESNNIARSMNAYAIWSFPRQTSFHSYQRAGYIQMSPWINDGEFGPNCYAIAKL